MSFAIVSLIILVVIAVVAIPILMRVFGEATRRNPNRPENEDRTADEGGADEGAADEGDSGR